MAQRIEITEGEILEALAAEGTAPEDARTMDELRAQFKIGEKKMRQALRAIAAENRLQVHKVVRRSLDGRPILVPAYTVTAKKRAKK